MARSQLASEIATARQEVDAWSMGRRAFHEMGQTAECHFAEPHCIQAWQAGFQYERDEMSSLGRWKSFALRVRRNPMNLAIDAL